MRIAIDLLWVRPGKNGGTESVIRNLLIGFGEYAGKDQFILLASKDNYDSFETYKKYKNIELVKCGINSASRLLRVMWEQINITSLVKKYRCDIFFSPIYSMPFKNKRIPSVALIHDLQALHFPEYFSFARNLFMKMSWISSCKKSTKIITISKFCKKDIIENLPISEDRVEVIYNPIISEDTVEDNTVLSRINVMPNEYYYTVSSLAKHKNLLTLLKAFQRIIKTSPNEKLVITGVRVNAASEINNYITGCGLQDNVIFTGYISNAERDALYKNCKVFVFPSIFEGFGMPPIEAMKLGIPTVTTDKASLEEVTDGKAIYVQNPFDEAEWVEKINIAQSIKTEIIPFEQYELGCITNCYLDIFHSMI